MSSYVRAGRYPSAYYHVNSPSIPKKANETAPLKQRILAVFSAVYRIEAGAWAKIIMPWFIPKLHPKIFGGIPRCDSSDATWEAQADIEEALLAGTPITLGSLDYHKYYDSFDYDWVKGFLIFLGFPQAYVELHHNLYTNMRKTLKIGGALGIHTHSYNGLGQGDVASTFPVLAHTSGQFYMLAYKLPNLRMGAIIDDRNVRGSFDDVIEACRLATP